VSATTLDLVRRTLADRSAAAPAAELLARYAARRDPDAFAALVRQFGPLVLGVCRRVLGPSADADDAFQTVFVALARRAHTFRDGRTLPAWLHRVALRTARKTLARIARDPGVPAAEVAEPVRGADPFAAVAWRDVRRVLDEELDALPEKVRAPVVLCWLDGLTQDAAAGRLGVSLNTLKRRLGAGRELLRARLARRGLAPVAVAAAVLVPGGLRADVPAALRQAVVEAVRGLKPAAPLLPKLLWAAAAVVAVGCGAALVAAGHAPQEVAPPPRPALPPERPDAGAAFPLPPGAVARFGSMHFRAEDRIHAAALSPDGTRLAVADGSAVRVFEAATWRLLHTLRADGGHGSWVNGHLLTFSPDGRRLAQNKNGRYAFAWELATGKLLHRFDSGDDWGWQAFCAFTPDGLLALSDKDKLRFFDPATGVQRRAVGAANVTAL
jgi:RNA polymerase sigma factor (sigma-70 family)